MSDELKTCPHCGNSDHLMVEQVEGENISPDNFQVVCGWLSGGCGASGGVRRTEAEAIAVWNQRADDTPINEKHVPSLKESTEDTQVLTDSREQIEAEVREWTTCSWVTVPHWRIIDWLDRQTVITRFEVDEMRDCADCTEGMLANMQQQVDSLTAERDRLADERYRYKLQCERWETKNAELTAERNKLRKQLAGKQHVIDVQRDSFRKMEAELSKAKIDC